MSADLNIPIRFETILVHYLVDDDLVWWPALVDDVSCTGSGAERRASGVLVFDARHGYEKQHVSVDFLHDDMLREQSVRPDGSRPDRTEWRVEEQENQNDSDHEDFPPPDQRRCSTRIASRNQNSRSARQRQSTRRTTRSRQGTRGGRCVQGNDVSFQEMRAEVSTLKAHVETLHRKLMVHERHFLSERDMATSAADKDLVNVMKMSIRNKILVDFQKPPRRPTVVSTEREFSSALRRGHMKCTVDCDLNMFKLIAKDVLSTCSTSSQRTVFLPSLPSILQGPHGMPLARILFEENVALFKWLQLRDPSDRDNLRMRTQCTQTVQAIRLISGMQVSSEDPRSGMTIFPGRSCSPLQVQAPLDPGSSERCLHRNSTFWDEENNAFVDSLELGNRSTGFSAINDINKDTSTCITLTWAYRDGVSSHMWSVDATNTGDVTIGSLEIHIPVVYCYGMRNCAEVENLISQMQTQ